MYPTYLALGTLISLENPWKWKRRLILRCTFKARTCVHKAADLFLEVADGVLVGVGEKVEDFVLYVILFQVVHQVGPVALKKTTGFRSVKGSGPVGGPKRPTLTCSLDVTAQKTISVNPCDGNIRKQIPPITRPSLIKDSVLCFLGSERRGESWSTRSEREAGKREVSSRVEDQSRDVLLGHAGQLVREDVLEADEPHQDPLIGLLVEGVTDDVEFDHAPALLQTGGFVTCRVRGQQVGLLRDANASRDPAGGKRKRARRGALRLLLEWRRGPRWWT